MGDGLGGSKATANFKGCSDSTKSCAQPGETAQVDYDVALTTELQNQHATGGPAIGGFLMSWVDENWKSSATQDQCTKHTCPLDQVEFCLASQKEFYKVDGDAGCTYKAHITCPNLNTTQHDLCGYLIPSTTPDNYVNEAWFGIKTG